MLKRLIFLLSILLMFVACGTLMSPVTPAKVSVTQLKGVNLNGAEFGTAKPGVKGTDYTWPTPSEVDYFMSKGMNTFRIGFSWERLQPTLNGAFATTYASDLDTIVTYASNKGATVILNPHNFARYNNLIIGSTNVPNSAFSDLWLKLATKYKANNRVVFGLMNEPHTMPTEQWVSAANAATLSIRNVGALNAILVPGNSWTSAQSWTSTWYGTSNAVGMLSYVDSKNNYVIEVHNYLDTDASGQGTECVSASVGVDRMQSVVAWARQNNKKVVVGEVGAPNTPTCKLAVTNLLAYLSQNVDVVQGWLWWAAGPWWGTYQLSLEPANGVDKPQMTWLAPYLSNSTSVDAGSDTGSVLDSSVVSSTKPTAPITFTKETTFTTLVNGVTNWVWVPKSYDTTHQTPTPVFVWLHGCGGRSQYDIEMISYYPSQNWISLTVGGREGTCWSTYTNDNQKVLGALADLKTHFNVDPKRVYLGGYSSGGDIGYELAFKNANLFAGLLYENTGPSSAAMTASQTSAWKLNIAHLAHTGDTTYPIASIRTKMATLKSAGFPVTLIEKPGNHWDNDTGSSGTAYDLRTYLLPYLNAGWVQGGVVPPATCTYTYSTWSTCQTNGTQTRTVVTSSPSVCVGNPVLNQACVYVPPVCTYTYSSWSTCPSTGVQSRTTVSSTPSGCVGTPVLTQNCTYVPPPDSDGDGVTDDLDKCPSVKGVKTSDSSTNGCLPFVVTATKTYDWGTGYCKQYYFKNPNTMPMSWTKMILYFKDGTLRGPGSVWGAIFPNPSATGTVVITPTTLEAAKIGAGQTMATIGFCANYGPLKYAATSGGLTY